MAALLRKKGSGLDNSLNNFGMAVIIKATPKSIQYQPLFTIKSPKTDSFTSFDYETPDGIGYFLLALMEDGAFQVL